mgnify:CR=1 FL=1
MKILIIEDNHSKLNRIKDFLLNTYNEVFIHDAMSYTAGLRRLYEEEWDLVLLDMSLPVYDMNIKDSGGDKKYVAGKEIMKRMLHRGIIIPTIIITQFDTFGENGITIESLNEEFSQSLSSIWKGTVNYGESLWSTVLNERIEEIIGGKI